METHFLNNTNHLRCDIYVLFLDIPSKKKQLTGMMKGAGSLLSTESSLHSMVLHWHLTLSKCTSRQGEKVNRLGVRRPFVARTFCQ